MLGSLSTHAAERRIHNADCLNLLKHWEEARSPGGDWTKLLIWLAFLGLALLELISTPRQFVSPGVTPVWRDRPVLGYFSLTASLVEPLQRGAGLSDAQLWIIRQVARFEVEQLENLQQKSLAYLLDPGLPLDQKRAAIVKMGYNQRVYEISLTSQQILRLVLPSKTYERFARWMEARWQTEQALHGVTRKAGAARTFEIYATRYDSKGAYYVALPDQCVKFTNGGNRLCEKDGYVVGQRYDVYVSYKKGVAARVGESGPWNVDDAYWATWGDPTPRRMFADLSLGMPEAQAAYFNGYNGGADQYGRKVTAPYGIDLARQVSVDIGLEPGNNDWIQVGFLWTENWGQPGAGAAQAPAQSATQLPAQTPTAAPKAVTPQADGSLVVVVQPGQTLWEIAAINGLSLQELLDLNNLSQDALIRDGEKLLVKGADPGLPLTQTANAIVPTDTPRPTRTPTITLPPTQTSVTQIVQAETATATTAQPGSARSEKAQKPAIIKFISGTNPWLLVIVGIVVAGLILILAGLILDRIGR
jgi:LysM repeat protein